MDVQDDKPLAPAPVAQADKQEPAKAQAQAEKTEGKQLPSTGEGADANLLTLGFGRSPRWFWTSRSKEKRRLS